MTQEVKSGDTIKVDYTGKFENGDVFDTSEGKTPLKFTVGAGMLIKGFDQAVMGMQVGDKKTITVQPEEGYGIRNEEAFVDIPRANIPEDIPLTEGLAITLSDPDGRPIPAMVAEITDDNVKMDLNHALAGKVLEFDIKVVETGLEPDPPGCGCGSDPSGCDSSGCESSGCGSSGCDC
ncbi:MAG: peptidylprolyl isomerase [Desulfobacteraceae bacterium]|nr:peptidylprolyl isomerase [Desulfobacteraceae bacterium]